MLHITNGANAVVRLADASVPGEYLPWNDVLHEGPVPEGLGLRELSEVRARFIADRGWGALDKVRDDFERRDAALTGFHRHDAVVLWFEHDLYDQLQLLQLLDWLASQGQGSVPLTAVATTDYLGHLGPDRIRALYDDRRPVTDVQLELGRRAWARFRAPDPTRIETLLAGDLSALPFLAGALGRHLQQFPSVENGLSRSESQSLRVIAAGAATPGSAFQKVQEMEDAIFLGDTVFAGYLEDLGTGEEPLLVHTDGARVRARAGGAGEVDGHRGPDGGGPVGPGFWDRELRLTPAGEAVLEGRRDRVDVSGLDRWLGGVHLKGPEPGWRWDDAGSRLVERPTA
jgi:hypothetical protein